MSRVLKVLAIIITVGLLSTLGFIWSLAHRARAKADELSAKQEADRLQFRDRIDADSARWKDEPLLAPHPGGDAAALLFAHLRWESDQAAAPPVPEAVAAMFKTWGPDWATHSVELDRAGLELGWFSQLETFGFWDLEADGSPLRDAPFEPLTETLPSFLDLQALAKLRLAHGLEAGAPARAAREVRELSRLCLTTESLVGEMVGVSLLGIERRAHAEALRRGQPLDGWTPVSEEDQESLRRVLMVAQAPYSMIASDAYAATRPALGACAGLREGLTMAYYLHDYLQDERPARYASLSKALEDPRCRLRRARLYWGRSGQKGQLPLNAQGLCAASDGLANSGGQAPSCSIPEGLLEAPFVRSFIAENFVVLAVPDWFARYRPAAQ